MAALTEEEKRILDLINALPMERRQLLLSELTRDSAQQRNAAYGEAQLRKLATSRGLNWDQLDDERRQEFVDDLLHESD